MKAPPESKTATLREVAACDAKSKRDYDTCAHIVNKARERARFYFARHGRTGQRCDILRAIAFQSVLVGFLEARRP